METNSFYMDFYYKCLGTLDAYRNIVSGYQEEVDELQQRIKDLKNSPFLVKEYRKNLRTLKKRLQNYRNRMVCLEDMFRRYGMKEHA